jgi:glycopeptide antibiotics resistance protein
MSTKKQRRITVCLTILYLAGVSAVILFKFPFRGDSLGSTRVVELTPFFVREIKNASFFRSNLIYNFLFFIPLGVFICVLEPERGFIRQLAPLVLLSLSYEVVQFVLGIGISDITDLITNSAGSAVGIVLHLLIQKTFGKKAPLIISAGGLCLVAGMLILFALAARFMIR